MYIKKYLLWVILSIFLATSMAAAETSEELLKKLETASQEEVPSILSSLSQEYLETAPKLSLKFAEKALEESKKMDMKKESADALNSMGMANYLLSDYSSSIESFKESIIISDSISYETGLGLANNGLGLVYSVIGDIEKSKNHFELALESFEKSADKKRTAQALNNIGSLYDMQGEYQDALQYYMKSLDINIEIENKEEIATCLNNIGYVNQSQGYYSESFNYYLQALKSAEDVGDKKATAVSLNNIAQIHVMKTEYESGLDYLSRALDIYIGLGDKKSSADTLGNMGYVYDRLEDYDHAIDLYSRSLAIREEIGDKTGIINSKNNIGTMYYFSDDFQSAINYHSEAYKDSVETGYSEGVLSSLQNLAFDYKATGDSDSAFDFYEKYDDEKSRVLNLENRRIVAEMENKYESDKKQMKIELLSKDNKMKTFKYWTQLIVSIISIIALSIVGFLGLLIRKEKKKSEKLLLNVLPQKVANDLKNTGKTEPQVFEDVTVYFSDIVGFTNASSELDPKFLIDELNDIFTNFDNIMEKYNCERIKTIGDAYLSIAGLYDDNPDHASRMTKASLEILSYLDRRNEDSDVKWQIRIGLHSGKIVGGVVGVKKYIYDVFGDTINTASRMESNSDTMMINISQQTHDLLGDEFDFISRQPVEAKGKGLLKMYFVKR